MASSIIRFHPNVSDLYNTLTFTTKSIGAPPIFRVWHIIYYFWPLLINSPLDVHKYFVALGHRIVYSRQLLRIFQLSSCEVISVNSMISRLWPSPGCALPLESLCRNHWCPVKMALVGLMWWRKREQVFGFPWDKSGIVERPGIWSGRWQNIKVVHTKQIKELK